MFLLCQTITFWIIILGKAGACYQKSRTDNRSPNSPGRKSQNFVIFNDTSRSLDMKQETEYWEVVTATLIPMVAVESFSCSVCCQPPTMIAAHSNVSDGAIPTVSD